MSAAYYDRDGHRGLGFSDAQIAARFGIQVESLQRFLDRHGIVVAS